MTKRIRLTKLDVHGYKSIRDMFGFEIRPLNVLIGANGAGKSNLLSLFELFAVAHRLDRDFDSFVAMSGGASSFLYEGHVSTERIKTGFGFVEYDDVAEKNLSWVEFLFSHGQGDKFERVRNYTNEKISELEQFLNRDTADEEYGDALEYNAIASREWNDITRSLSDMTKNICTSIYKFHNTSTKSRFMIKWPVDDCLDMKRDGGNLAPYLYRMRERHPACYHRVIRTLTRILPFFSDFVLEPEHDTLLLRWREVGSDLVYGPGQGSDGMLRLFALVTLLQQPEEWLPALLIVDEPELGLHPYAIAIIAGLFQSASRHTQVLLATQSPNFVDQFDPEDIVVVERKDRESLFRRLEPERLKEWLEEYSLGELWQKNVLGGQP